MGSLARSIPPSLRDTKRNPLGIRIHPVDENQSHVFTGMDGSSAVMAVTLLRDGGYSGPFRLDAHFELPVRCKMQRDERDLIEVLLFDEIEETVGSWLRAIILRLEKEQMAIRRHQQRRPTSGHKTLRGTPLSIYAHTLPASQRRAANRVSEVLFSTVLELGEKPQSGKPN